MSKNNFFNILILVIVFIASGSSISSSKWVAIGLTLILLIIHTSKEKSINPKITYILLVWIGMNLLAIYVTGSQFIIARIINYSFALILLPYLVLSIMGKSFWYRFEKIIFILTFISIPIFLANIMFPSFFHSLVDIFRPITADAFYSGEVSTTYSSTYWSSLIYVNAISIGEISPMRNSGFMWEPGAFAMIIIWAIVFNWLTKGIKFNKRFFVYAIALVTTLSTSGYLALFVVILAFYIKKGSFINVIMLVMVSIIFNIYIYTLDFVGGEINWYLENYYDTRLTYSPTYNAIKVSRFQIIPFDIVKVINHPFGYGVVTQKDYSSEIDIIGTNGVTSLLKMWGIPLFIFIIYLLKRYLNLLNINLYNKSTIFLLLIGIMIMFFSNPIQRNIFFYLIVLTPLLFKDLKLKHEEL